MPPKKRADKQRRALGSVFLRADGKWVAKVDLGTQGGQRRRITRYAKSEKEAEKVLAEMIAESGRGALQAPTTTTVKEWLDGQLARKHTARASKPATIREDKRLAGLIESHIGTRRLTALHGAHVQGLMHDLAHYSPRTRRKLLQLLTTALDEAVALDLLARNPAKAITLPRQAAAETKHVVWSKAQAEQFLREVRGHRLYALYRLMLGQGLRLGEAVALQLEHYDPEAATLRVQQTIQRESWEQSRRTTVGTPKTRASVRLLTLPADLNAELRSHLQRRETEARSSLTKGLWNEEGWLVPSEMGTMLGDRNVARHLDEMQARLNARAEEAAKQEAQATGKTVQPSLLPRITPHGLRYTFINLAIRSGAPFDVVAAIVGHTSPVITMKVYRQIQADEIKETGSKLDGLFSLE